MQPKRMTWQTRAILIALLDQPESPVYGLELTRRAGLPSGTVYPVLARLEEAGWITSAWENVDPQQVARPRRRLYRLTSAGMAYAPSAVDTTSRRTLNNRLRQPEPEPILRPA